MTARILVVDDVVSNARLLEARLTDAYYEVRTARDGHAALALARDWLPDLILLDVMMPGADGYEVCRALKSAETTASIPVILVTALRDAPDRVRGLDAGADDFLTKPLEYEILQARVKSALRLKRITDEWRARGMAARALALAARPSAAADGGTVLIVDDFAARAARLHAVLKRGNRLATTAVDERAALEAAASNPPDLVVLSLGLIGDDPLRLIARLGASADTRDIPILVLGDKEDRRGLANALEMGAADCLMMPLDDDELAMRARNLVRRKLLQDRLRADVDRALAMAVSDPLTGLFNRRYLLGALAGHARDPGGRTLAACMIDVDHFKRINDEHGHAVGDLVLTEVADRLRAAAMPVDLVARLGGEEFIVLTDAADAGALAARAETLRETIEGTAFRNDIRITVSVGVASVDPDASPEETLCRADRALYAAKRAGRNLVRHEPAPHATGIAAALGR